MGMPLSGVKIEVAGLSTITNSVGHFEFTIPGDRLQQELDLGAVASGYSSSHLKVVPNGNDVVIPLTRRDSPMLYRLLIFVLLVLAKLPVDAATLKGVILANELNGPPIENVGVDAISGTNLTIRIYPGNSLWSSRKGESATRCASLSRKRVTFVVNDVQLETVLPADADAAPLTIILAKEEDREEMARRFYRLKSFDAIDQKLKTNKN